MRRILLVVLAGIASRAGAARRVTVAQLEQALAAAHKPDAETARLIAGLDLTERLTESTQERLAAHLEADSKAALALQADRSALLDPPSSELPATPAPDEVAQQRMLESARQYGSETLPRLPNFLATRTINEYDDSPQEVTKGAWPVRAGLHLVRTSSRETSVRDERENQSPEKDSGAWKEQSGLVSGGEFGGALGMLLADTTQGTVRWSHWEQDSAGLVAVFGYAVPKSASHFEIMGTVRGEAALEGHAASMGGRRGIQGIGVSPSGAGPAKNAMVHSRPGYHGSIWVDPATGASLRITMEADAKDSAPFRQAAILVQYGAVKIGGNSFICPVRSLALSMAEVQTLSSDAPAQWLNETLFTGYRRFASTTRILTDATPPQ